MRCWWVSLGYEGEDNTPAGGEVTHEKDMTTGMPLWNEATGIIFLPVAWDWEGEMSILIYVIVFWGLT